LFTSSSTQSASIARYGVQAGEITPVGEKHLFDLGALARRSYVNSGFMPEVYNPQTVLVRGPNDGCAILSGYSYIMGMYPESVEGLDLDNFYGGSDVNVPIVAAEVDRVRQDVGSRAPTCGSQRVDFYPGNDDKEFLIKPMKLYPEQKTQINKNLNAALKEFEQKYGDGLYQGLAREMNKPESDFNFANAVDYLDEYIVAQENSHATYNLDTNTDELVTEYYNYYFKNGLFRDEAITREFTNSYFLNLIQELEMKRKSLDGRNSNGQLIDELKYSIHIGNHQTYAAILHVLGVRDHYRLDFSQIVSWEMFGRGGKYYVRPLHNGRSIELEGNVDDEGEVELDILFEYLCSKLYYGDDILEAKGFSSPSDYNDKTLHCLGAESFRSSIHKSSLSKSLSEIANNPTTCEFKQEPVQQMPIYHEPVQHIPIYQEPIQQAPVRYVAPVTQSVSVLQPASILKGLVDSSPTYDANERTQMNAPRGSETYVAPVDNNNYDGIQGDGRYGGNYQNVRRSGQYSRQAPASSASSSRKYVSPTQRAQATQTTRYVPPTQRVQATETQGNTRYGSQTSTQSGSQTSTQSGSQTRTQNSPRSSTQTSTQTSTRSSPRSSTQTSNQSSQNIRDTPKKYESYQSRPTQYRSGSSNVVSTPETHQNWDHYQSSSSRSPQVTAQRSSKVTAAPKKVESLKPTARPSGTARPSATSGSNTISHHSGGFSAGVQPAINSDGTLKASTSTSKPKIYRPELP
jgi:hypothetical protein